MRSRAIRYYRWPNGSIAIQTPSTSSGATAPSESTTQTLDSHLRTAAVIVAFFVYYLFRAGGERREREDARA